MSKPPSGSEPATKADDELHHQLAVSTPHGAVTVWADGSGTKTVLLLHGLGGNRIQAFGFTPPARELGNGWMRHAVEMHGPARPWRPDPAPLGFRTLAGEVIAVLEYLNRSGHLVRALIGMSMGAEVALQAAYGRPDLVPALVLIRPARAGGIIDSGMAPLYRQIADLMEMYGADGRQHFVRTPEYRAVERLSRPTAASLRRQFDAPDRHERAAMLRSVPVSETLGLEAIASIEVPALVVVSPGDPAHPMSCGRVIADAMPAAAPLRILPQKLEEPGRYEQALRAATSDFLYQMDTRSG